jgi:hypothetical protein
MAQGDRSEDVQMRRVQDHEARDPLGVARRDRPGDDPAPVVSHQDKTPGAEGVGQRRHVPRQRVERVVP